MLFFSLSKVCRLKNSILKSDDIVYGTLGNIFRLFINLFTGSLVAGLLVSGLFSKKRFNLVFCSTTSVFESIFKPCNLVSTNGLTIRVRINK